MRASIDNGKNMNRTMVGILIAGFLIFATTAAHSATQNYSASETSWVRSWMGQHAATGDWNGIRNELEDQGITISSNFTTDISGIASPDTYCKAY